MNLGDWLRRYTGRQLALAECRRLYAILDDLIDADKGDSDEAEAIRDQCDEPWHRMGPFEEARLRKELSS